jgi:hypothetical protein
MKRSATTTTDPVVVKTAPADDGVGLRCPCTTNPLGPEFEAMSEESKIKSATHSKQCGLPLREAVHIQFDLARNTVRKWNTNRHPV